MDENNPLGKSVQSSPDTDYFPSDLKRLLNPTAQELSGFVRRAALKGDMAEAIPREHPYSSINGLQPETTSDADAAMQEQPAPLREKDEVFWTELEIRRLGNLVAECIHTRRYVGDDKSAEVERQEMRKYVEAMKRKSMRVLHRAELYARSGHAAWPGIDPTITDPVSLAEEYVRVVENYEAVLSEEETRARQVRTERSALVVDDEPVNTVTALEEDWEVEDDVAYREALEREKMASKTEAEKRKDLMGDAEGIRRRKGKAGPSDGQPSSYSKEDEQLMARHQPIQDELTSNLVDLVGQLKESISANNDKLAKDSKVLDETEDAVDKNVSGISKQRDDLKQYTQSTSTSWWVMMVAAAVILVVFVFVLILLKVPL